MELGRECFFIGAEIRVVPLVLEDCWEGVECVWVLEYVSICIYLKILNYAMR